MSPQMSNMTIAASDKPQIFAKKNKDFLAIFCQFRIQCPMSIFLRLTTPVFLQVTSSGIRDTYQNVVGRRGAKRLLNQETICDFKLFGSLSLKLAKLQLCQMGGTFFVGSVAVTASAMGFQEPITNDP